MHPTNLAALQAIEKELSIKLEELAKIDLTSKGYVLNPNGQVMSLVLYDCKIQDLNCIIAPLKDLTQLTVLDLSENQISELSALKDLTQLTVLNLGVNQISELSALKDLKQLTKLDLRRNQISELSALKDLKQLTGLGLEGNQISELSALKDLSNLTLLWLQRNPIEVLPKWITEFDMDIQWTDNYPDNSIVLYDNPLKSPPVEVVKQGKQAGSPHMEWKFDKIL